MNETFGRSNKFHSTVEDLSTSCSLIFVPRAENKMAASIRSHEATDLVVNSVINRGYFCKFLMPFVLERKSLSSEYVSRCHYN